MAIGERIRFIRNLRGMTQKWLGQAVGFPQKTADVRMAQYESGSRTPKEDLVKALANVLEVSPLALSIPDIDSNLGFIHTLFAIEDIQGVRAEKQGDEVHIVFDGSKLSTVTELPEVALEAENLPQGAETMFRADTVMSRQRHRPSASSRRMSAAVCSTSEKTLSACRRRMEPLSPS